jgi:TRAP transporter 4TM/12TM fusion protein
MAPDESTGKTDNASKAAGMERAKGIIVAVIGAAMILFQSYTAYEGALTPMIQRGVHLAFAMCLLFLLYPSSQKRAPRMMFVWDAFLALLSMFVFVYAFVNFTEATTIRMVHPLIRDVIFGVVAILLVLEATRRTSGKPFLIVICCFFLYTMFGDYLPGAFGHAGMKWKYLLIYNYMTLDGIFGVATGTSAKMIFMIIIFGGTMVSLGAGDCFLRASYALLGRSRGGPAKIAVAASALMGMISGTGPAIAAATGVFTIPLMIKVGYKRHFAAAVEAVASSGGQIMPPVMGVAAFIMAEILNITYAKVCYSAVVSALLYYLAIYIMVHLEAVKLGLRGMSRDELPSAKSTLLEGWSFIIPVLLLIFMIGYQEEAPERAGLYSLIVLLVLHAARELIETRRVDIVKIGKALASGLKQAVFITAMCGAVGIIMSLVNLTGIGVKLSSILVSLSGGHVFILLFITMIASIILGMGMSTVACYVILATLAAPALIKMGIDPIAAHLFVFYFGIFSAITPPVAIGAYVCAGIAQSPPMITGWAAFKLGLAAFILPYMFVYSPALLLQGPPFEMVWGIMTATLGVSALAVAVEGHLFERLGLAPRLVTAAGALLLIHSGLLTDAIGFILVALGLSSQWALLIKRKWSFGS